jgi:hypothetical protein
MIWHAIGTAGCSYYEHANDALESAVVWGFDTFWELGVEFGMWTLLLLQPSHRMLERVT